MTILFAYDGSESADAAIAAAGTLLRGTGTTAVVLSVWEPLTVEALRAARFGGWPPIPTNVADVDQRTASQAKRLAEHGARLAGEAASRPALSGSQGHEGSPTRSSRAPTSSTPTSSSWEPEA